MTLDLSGNAAQWVVALIAFLAFAFTVYKHFADKKSKTNAVKLPDGKLSSVAEDLLKEASLDNNRVILATAFGVRTQEKNFDDDTPRSIAISRSAVEELEKSGYIKACGPSREQFIVTKKGYDLVDLSSGQLALKPSEEEAKKKGWWQFWR
jgi:hypothetical protein